MKPPRRLFLGLIVTFLTLSVFSSLLIQPIANYNTFQTSFEQNEDKKYDGNVSSWKLNSPIGGSFTPGATLTVEDILDRHNDTSLSVPDNIFWPVPNQAMHIYMIDETDPTNNLTITGGNNQVTTGVDGSGGTAPNNVDDVYGVLDCDSDDCTTLRANHASGYYHIEVLIPNQSVLQTKGINNTLKIIEFFPGNASTGLASWINREYNISLVNTASISEVSSTYPSMLSNGNTSIDFELRFDNGGSVIDNISFTSFAIYNDSDQSLICSDSIGCLNKQFSISFPSGTVTDINGIVTMDIQMLTSPSIIRGRYWVNITAETDPQYSNTPTGGTSFDIVWNNATLTLDMIPLDVMKPHESKLITANLTSDYDDNPITGEQLSFEITYQSNGSFICNSLGGCLIRGFNITSSSVTDSNGLVTFTLTTNYQIVGDDTYTFTVTPTNPFNPDSAPFFITNNPISSVEVVIDRDPKIGMLEFLGNSPGDTLKFRPTESVTLDFLTKTDKNATYPNVPIIIELWDLNGIPTIISNGTGNLWYFSNLISDGLGNVSVVIDSTSVNTPTGDYRLTVTADYSGFLGIDQYLQNSYSTPYLFNFTVDNQFDGIIQGITVVPSAVTQPIPGGSVVDVTINMLRDYNLSWQSYNGPAAPTPISGMRVRPDFISSAGIVLSINTISFPLSDVAGYYYSNVNGDLTVTITSTYPLTYENITKIIGFQLGINATETPFLSYYNSTQGMYVNNPQYNQLISIDPNYNIIDVSPAPTPTNNTGNIFTLGTAIELYFETKNNSVLISGIPVRFEITSGSLSGVYLAFTNGTPLSSNDYINSIAGQITILMVSTYGVTVETTSLLNIEVTATANVSIYNGGIGSIPGPPYHIGIFNAGTANFNQFSNTWSDTTLIVGFKTVYKFGEALWDSDDSNDEIRPGETINVTLTVVNNNTLSTIIGLRFSVNASIQCYVSEVLTSCSSIGVSLSIADTGVNPLSYANYYFTNANGQITLTLSSIYNPSFPESFKVRFNAIIDFENKTNVSYGDGAQFVVGHEIVGSFNRSQSSYSTNKFFNITFNPQYRTASVALNSVSIPSLGGGNTLVPTDNGVSVDVTFKVTLDIGNVPIGNVNVTLNLTLLAEQNVTVIGQAWGFTDSGGLVTFGINVTTSTVDGWYTVQAFADFLNDNLLTPPQDILNNNRPIAYQWINGTSFGSNSNSSYTIDTYQVLRLRLMIVNILAVYDTFGALISTGPTNVFAYRGYTLRLNVTYVLNDFTPVSGTPEFTVFYNQSLNQPISLFTGTTDLDTGNRVFNTTLNIALPGTFYGGAAQLYATPTDAFFNDPAQTFFQPFNFQIRSTPTINALSTNVTGTDTLKEGDSITVRGTFIDELGFPLTTTKYLSSALNELNYNLQVYGLEALNENTTSSLGLNATGGFEIVYTIPNGFSNTEITLWFEIIDNSTIDTFDLTDSLVQTIKTYQFLSIDLNLDSTLHNSPFPGLNLQNMTIFNVNGNTEAFAATITFLDNYGRPLENYQVWINNNGSFTSRTTDMNGEVPFSISSSPEYFNSTRDFDLSYNNGSVPSFWMLDIIRILFDTTAPNLEFISPNPNIPSEYSYLYADFPVLIDAYDYNSSYGFVTAGFSQGSLIILHNGTPVTPGSWIDGDTYQYIFDFASLPFSITAANITIILTDNAGLTNQSTLIITFDRFAPVISGASPGNNSYPYGIGPVSVNVTDIGNSVTGVDVRVITTGTDITTPLIQVNGTHWENTISLDYIDSDAFIIFRAIDDAGNIATLNYTYLIDTVNPVISIVTIDTAELTDIEGESHYIAPLVEVTIIATITDNESGVSPANLLINSIPQSNVTKSGDEYTIIFKTPVVTSTELQTLTGTDRAGNPFSIQLFTILFDNIQPNIIINSPTNGNPYYDIFTIEFDVIDLETSVNASLVEIFDNNNNPLNFSFITITNGYRFTLQETPDYNAVSSLQNYTINARDTYNNLNTSSFYIFTDVVDPVFGDFEIKAEEDLAYIINPSLFNATGSHNIVFNYDDSGTYRSGVVDIEISLSHADFGSSSFLGVNIANYNITVDSDSLATRVDWITELGTSTEVPEGIYKWTLVITDGVGHNATEEFVYELRYNRKPLIDQIIEIGTTFLLALAVFGGLGVAVAYVYEKIRYQ